MEESIEEEAEWIAEKTLKCNDDHWHSGCRIPALFSQYLEVHGQFFLCYTQLMIIVGLCLDSGK